MVQSSDQAESNELAETLKGLKDSEEKLMAMLNEMTETNKNGVEQEVKVISVILTDLKITVFEFLCDSFFFELQQQLTI